MARLKIQISDRVFVKGALAQLTRVIALTASGLLLFGFFATADSTPHLNTPSADELELLRKVKVEEHLGLKLDLKSYTFLDAQSNQELPLSEIIDLNKPTILNLVYFECPTVCTLILNGVVDGLRKLDWTLGQDFNMLTVSINPHDTVKLALTKKENYIKYYLRDSNRSFDREDVYLGWHFLVSPQEKEIQRFAHEVGFLYQYNPKTQEYVHPSVTVLISPEGTITRYLYGTQYLPQDLKFALMEAGKGKVGGAFGPLKFTLYGYFYSYDDLMRTYVLDTRRALKVGAAIILVLLGLAFSFFFQKKGQPS